jgi:hypothetical protein
MPWDADKDLIEKFVQQDFPAVQAAEFDETVVTDALNSAIAIVDSALQLNGYVPATIQADTTTNSYQFLNALVLKCASVRVLRWLRSSTPQGKDLNLDNLEQTCKDDLDFVRMKPELVLGDLTLPSDAPSVKTDNVVKASTDDSDLRPAATFTRETIIY